VNVNIVGGVVGAILLSGCTSMMQKKDFESFNTQVGSGHYQEAAEVALEHAGYDPESGETDDLLWTIQAGATLNYAGNYALSTKLLDASEAMMKVEDTEGMVSETSELIGATVGNDAMLAYEQTQYDGVMANTIKAWNFLSENNYQDARVEFNRAEERQRRAAEHFAKVIKAHKEELEEESGDAGELVNQTLASDATQKVLKDAGIKQNQWKPYEGYVNPFTTYSYGLHLLLTGKTKSDYRKAADSFKRVYSLTDSSAVKNDYELAISLAKSPKASKLNNKVWVIFENGQSVVREERRLDLPVFILSDNISYMGIALPTLKARGIAFDSISVNDNKTQVVADMDKIIGAEFDDEFPYILAREITRITLKTIAQKQIKDKNPLLGHAFGVLQALTTGADIRSFSALPSQYQVTHFDVKNNIVEIKAGTFTIPVELDTSAQKHIIYIKAVSPTIQPTIRVVNI